jgi:hypothetical protein
MGMAGPILFGGSYFIGHARTRIVPKSHELWAMSRL